MKYRLNIHLLNGQIKYLECEKKGARRVKLFRNIFRLLSHYCFLYTDTSQISRERTFSFLKEEEGRRRNKNFPLHKIIANEMKEEGTKELSRREKFIGAQNLGQKIFHFIVCIT